LSVSAVISNYRGFRSYEVHIKPPPCLRGGVGGGVILYPLIGKCCNFKLFCEYDFQKKLIAEKMEK
ncbi:MAG: hypothetical protein ACKPKT_13685, partial [Dolichospermum sp.]